MTKKASEIVEELSKLIEKHGDLYVYADVNDYDYNIDSINFSTAVDGRKFFSLTNYD